MTGSAQHFASIVDKTDWVVYFADGWVAFPRDVTVRWLGGGWELSRPTAGRLHFGRHSTIVFRVVVHISAYTMCAALARELDDGGSKRVWTFRELIDLELRELAG